MDLARVMFFSIALVYKSSLPVDLKEHKRFNHQNDTSWDLRRSDRAPKVRPFESIMPRLQRSRYGSHLSLSKISIYTMIWYVFHEDGSLHFL